MNARNLWGNSEAIALVKEYNQQVLLYDTLNDISNDIYLEGTTTSLTEAVEKSYKYITQLQIDFDKISTKPKKKRKNTL